MGPRKLVRDMTFDEIYALMSKGAERSSFADRIKFDCGADGIILVTPEGVSQTDGPADCTLTMSTENLSKVIQGKLNPMMGFTLGKIKLAGNPAIALKLASLIKG